MLAQQERRQQQNEQRARGLQENRAGRSRMFVRLHVEQRGRGIREPHEYGAPGPAAPRFGNEDEDREQRERGPERRELPGAEAAKLDGRAPGREEQRRNNDLGSRAHGGGEYITAPWKFRSLASTRAPAPVPRCGSSPNGASRCISWT